MKKSLMAVGVIAMLTGALLAADLMPDKVTVVSPKNIQWADAKAMPKGVQTALVHGDPAKGPSVLLMRAPAGTAWAPHTHSADEIITVVSGTMVIGEGEKVDMTKEREVEAGGYFTVPSKLPHWAKAKTDIVISRYGAGPHDIHYCNPADEPGK